MQKPNCSNISPSERGSAPSCEGCPYQSQCKQQAGNLSDPGLEKIKLKLSKVKNIILVLSGKGGVGKSTVASQLALALSQNKNLQIGLLDIDICGPSIPRMLGLVKEEVHKSSDGWSPVYKEDNLAVMSIGFLLTDKNSAVIWRGPRKNGLIVQFLTDVNWDELDYLIIDTPPGTSDEHLSIVSYLKECNLKGALIVTTPQEVSLSDVRKEVNFCLKTYTNIIGVIENMSGFICPKCNELTEIFSPNTGGAEAMCKELNLKLLAKIPIEINVVQATESGKSIFNDYKNSETAKAFTKIVNELLKIK